MQVFKVKYKLFLLFFTGLLSMGFLSYGFTTTIQVDSVRCNGGSDGKIVVTVSGGTAPFIFTWSTGQKDTTNTPADSLVNIAAGNYWVVIDDAGSSDFHSIEVYEPDAINIDAEDETDASCHGGNDGTITIKASRGTAPYFFSVDGGITFYGNNGYFTGLTAGDYQVVVRDDHGCTLAGSTLAVGEPSAIVIQTDQVHDVSCYGNSDGAIGVTITGGTSPYVYSWNGPNGYTSTNEDISGLEAGDYTLTVTDANGCVQNGSTVMVNEPSEIVFQSQVKTDVSCHGAGDGTITIKATGGTPPYFYSIDGGANWLDNGGVFTDLVPGNYSISIEDNQGCIQNGTTLTIQEPSALIITTQTGTDISCYGGSDGTITLQASGGTPPYVFSIDGGVSFNANGGSFSGLPAGSYHPAVRDANGCVTNGNVLTLSEPPVITPVIASQTNITCHGGHDGSITLQASGGTSPYEYSLNGGVSFENNGGLFTGLATGSWYVAVRDANGCRVVGDTITLTEPSAMQITALIKTDISCHGLTDGRIDISVSGGTSPWQYSIDGGANYSNDPLFTGLSAGDYDIVIRDANGCLLYGKTLTITDPPLLVVDSVYSSDVLCAGGNSGEVRIFATGGTGSYEYSVDNGTSFSDNKGSFTQLPATIYYPVVRDINGCTANGTQVTVNEPPAIQMIADTVKPTCNKHTPDGEITVKATGGTGNFVYSIDNGISFTSQGTFTGLEGGSYHLLAKDANGCIVSDNLELQGKITVVADAGRDTSICPGTSVPLNGSGGSSWQWVPAASLNDPALSDPVASPQATTDYIFKATTGLCYDADTVRVAIFPVHGLDAGRDTVVMEGYSITLTATGEGFVSYEWYPPEGLDGTAGSSVVATPDKDITYFVEATTTEGCLENDSIKLTLIREIFIPSGFTPNGDSRNDTWHFGHTEFYPEMTVEVFNRWGQRVFYSKGYDSSKEWDGKYNGKVLPSGTYYYVIILNDISHTPPLTGPVTIIR